MEKESFSRLRVCVSLHSVFRPVVPNALERFLSVLGTLFEEDLELRQADDGDGGNVEVPLDGLNGRDGIIEGPLFGPVQGDYHPHHFRADPLQHRMRLPDGSSRRDDVVDDQDSSSASHGGTN